MQISKNDKNYKANKLTKENENHSMHVKNSNLQSHV